MGSEENVAIKTKNANPSDDNKSIELTEKRSRDESTEESMVKKS